MYAPLFTRRDDEGNGTAPSISPEASRKPKIALITILLVFGVSGLVCVILIYICRLRRRKGVDKEESCNEVAKNSISAVITAVDRSLPISKPIPIGDPGIIGGHQVRGSLYARCAKWMSGIYRSDPTKAPPSYSYAHNTEEYSTGHPSFRTPAVDAGTPESEFRTIVDLIGHCSHEDEQTLQSSLLGSLYGHGDEVSVVQGESPAAPAVPARDQPIVWNGFTYAPRGFI